MRGLRNALLALKIKVPADLDMQSNALRVKKWLGNKDNGSWVLVLDNADDRSIHFQDILPQCKHGGVLFTSRDKRLASAIGATEVPVSVMTAAEAVELYWKYRSNTGAPPIHEANLETESTDSRSPVLDQDSQGDVERLVQKLGFFPMAIENAAAYLREANLMPGPNLTISDYTHALDEAVSLDQSAKDQIETILGFQEAFSPYPQSMLSVWELSLQMLMRESERGPKLLELLGFLGRNVSEDWIRAPMTTGSAGLAFADGRKHTLSREPTTLLRSEMSFLRSRVTYIATAAKLCNLSLVRRVYLSGQGRWYLDMHPLIHLWVRCRLADRPAHQASLFRWTVLLSEFSIGSPFVYHALESAKSDNQQPSTAFQSLVNTREYASDLPVECITFYLFMALDNYGQSLCFNETTANALLASVAQQEREIAGLLVRLGSAVFHLYRQLEGKEKNTEDTHGSRDYNLTFWADVEVTADALGSAPYGFTEQRIQTIVDILAYLISCWWKTVPSLGLQELYAIANGENRLSLQISATLAFMNRFCKNNMAEDMLHSARGPALAHVIFQYLPPDQSVSLLESHLNTAVHTLPAFKAVEYLDGLIKNLNNLVARKHLGPWGGKAWETFVHCIPHEHIHDALYSTTSYGWHQGEFLRDNPQSVYAVHNQRKLRETHELLANLLWVCGLRGKADCVLSHYILFVSDFKVIIHALSSSSGPSTTPLPAHWYCVAEDLQSLMYRFLWEISEVSCRRGIAIIIKPSSLPLCWSRAI